MSFQDLGFRDGGPWMSAILGRDGAPVAYCTGNQNNLEGAGQIVLVDEGLSAERDEHAATLRRFLGEASKAGGDLANTSVVSLVSPGQGRGTTPTQVGAYASTLVAHLPSHKPTIYVDEVSAPPRPGYTQAMTTALMRAGGDVSLVMAVQSGDGDLVLPCAVDFMDVRDRPAASALRRGLHQVAPAYAFAQSVQAGRAELGQALEHAQFDLQVNGARAQAPQMQRLATDVEVAERALRGDGENDPWALPVLGASYDPGARQLAVRSMRTGNPTHSQHLHLVFAPSGHQDDAVRAHRRPKSGMGAVNPCQSMVAAEFAFTGGATPDGVLAAINSPGVGHRSAVLMQVADPTALPAIAEAVRRIREGDEVWPPHLLQDALLDVRVDRALAHDASIRPAVVGLRRLNVPVELAPEAKPQAGWRSRAGASGPGRQARRPGR